MRQFDSLILSTEEFPRESGFEYLLNVPGQCEVPEASLVFTATIADRQGEPDLKSASARALLAPERLPDILQIRSRRPGDRYGGPGKRKVKRILIDAKIPLPARSHLPLVVAGDTVIWIPGFKPAKSFIASPQSGRCVILEARGLENRDSPKAADI
jgi:tRNA(Ile)-lysidine synthase